MAGTGEKTIIDLEKRFWQTIVDKDHEASITMIDTKSIVTGSQGLVQLTHDDYRRMAKQDQKWQLTAFELEDIKVVFPTDDIAIIAYKVIEEMNVDGTAMAFKAADATTWVRKDGKWVAVLHTESILGADPFRRYKKAA
jgi:hypothetical protein